MIKATFMKKVPTTKGSANLYRLSQPVEFGWDDDGGLPKTRYIIISALVTANGQETYIFPASRFGDMLDTVEMKGSYRGGLSHKQAILNAGWELKEAYGVTII